MSDHPEPNSKAVVILISGIVLASCWVFFFTKLLSLVKKCTFLPPEIYLPLEEFCALNAHHNSPYLYIGGFIIALAAVICFLKQTRQWKRFYRYLLCLTVFFALHALIFPCLCRPPEYARRAHCRSSLGMLYRSCAAYAGENSGFFPDTIDCTPAGHETIYHGKGRKLADPPFVILEDAGKVHAGDLRHRILSNGKSQNYYPWKN